MLSSEEVAQRKEAIAKRREEKRKIRRNRIIAFILFLVLGVVLMGITGYVSYRQSTPVTSVSQVEPDFHRTNILFMGIDKNLNEASRTDTMMLTSVNFDTGEIGVISIPRDTRIFFEEQERYVRINSIYGIAGAQRAVAVVSEILDVEIDYYVKTDFDGFRQIIDTIGGVEIEVEQEMQYVDSAQDLEINLQAGEQRLDGDQALQYVRFRDRFGDVSLVDPVYQTYDGRVERQRKFISSLVQELLHPRTVPKLPQLVKQLWNTVDTDLPLTKIVNLSMRANKLLENDIKTEVLPGTGGYVNGAAYWLVDETRTEYIVDSIIKGKKMPLRVEVLNGNGQAGIAGHVAELLSSYRVDVLRVNDAEHYNYPVTEFILYNEAVKDEVAQLVQLFNGELNISPDAHAKVDLTIIVGRNFNY